MVARVILALGALVMIAGLAQPTLRYFRRAEFGKWWPLMSADLLAMLDELRARWGRPIHISPVEGATGRADDTASQHNVLATYGVVRAVDLFPAGDGGGPPTRAEARDFVFMARSLGFTGIGVYPSGLFRGKPWTRFHLDNRLDRPAYEPATWGLVAGREVAIETAIEEIA